MLESLKEWFNFANSITGRSVFMSLVLMTFIIIIVSIAIYIIVFVRNEMTIKDCIEWGVGAVGLVGGVLFIIPILRKTNNLLSRIEKKL